jgi:hypothetical protein
MLLVLVICTNGDEQKMVMNLELQDWDSQEAGEGFSITSNIRRSSTHSICR